jgi:pyroglutamyl-peptidase
MAPMLRRRRKTAKNVKRTPHSAPLTSRRRARADAQIPPQLVVRPEHVAPEPASPPPRPAPRARGADGGVLVTGFEPFGGEAGNPSWDLCALLPDSIAGLRVSKVRVPCQFRRAIEATAVAIERERPSLVLCLGQAGGRAHLSVERVAINVDDARIADNAGHQPVDEPIAPDAPPAYFATVPVKAMVAAMRAARVPAEVSNSAGTFVCNHLMYGVLHFLAASGQKARAGFIHVPYAEAQVLDKRDAPAMSIESMTAGIAAAIEAAARTKTDIAVAEGALD